MKKLVIVLAAFLVLCFMPAGLADFGLSTSVTTQATCATDTVLYNVQVTNTGGLTDSYTVSMSGDAAEWAVAAPAGFNLEPGETENVYVYVTPVSGALVGTYDLKIIINSRHSGKESVDLNTEVANCHSVALTATTPSKEACVCTMVEYPLTIANTGRYTENFELSLSGNAAEWATLSDETVRLEAGESKEIFAYVTTDCDAIDEYELSVKAESQNSNALTSQQLNLISQPCYDFDMAPEKNYLSFCENTEVKVPVTIKNEGTADNTYTLKVDGPRWATMEKEKVTVPASSEEQIKLVLFPEYKVAGDFKIKVAAVGELGEVATEKELTANVLTCHSTDLKVGKERDVVCPYTSKVYEVSLANTGEYAEHYALSVSGADWATIDQPFVNLDSGNSQKVNLEINPKDVAAGKYMLKVTAESQDSCGTTDSDEIEIEIASKDKCFGVQASAALSSVDVTYGEGALIPVVIENKGTETSTYYLDVSGTGASYAQLNPATVELGGREAETIYLYTAVPEATPQTKYAVTVSARLEDGTVSSSTTVNVNVVSAEEAKKESIAEKTKELNLPEINVDREEVKANIGEKVSGLASGVSKDVSEEKTKASERLSGLKSKLSAFKNKTIIFLFTKTFWFYNWLWIAIIILVFAIIGAGISALPDEEEINKNQKKKNNKDKKEGGGFWKKIEDFLEEE
ncbi:hypothetical protein GF374_00855 [Candidatus Woesearchaeota archaeon]|nr:hypothetical protein [Candidatus Woesearchaeota archaeon]